MNYAKQQMLFFLHNSPHVSEPACYTTLHDAHSYVGRLPLQ